MYELGTDRVLRRYRDGAGMPPWEADVMRLAREGGVPVPEVLDIDGLDMVIERVNGPSMLEDLTRSPWRAVSHAKALVELHGLVHSVSAPVWLPPVPGAGACLLHMDLHPANVIMSRAGPVLLDWQGAARGSAATDLAHTYLLLITSTIPRQLAGVPSAGWVNRCSVLCFAQQQDRQWSTLRAIARTTAWSRPCPAASSSRQRVTTSSE